MVAMTLIMIYEASNSPWHSSHISLLNSFHGLTRVLASIFTLLPVSFSTQINVYFSFFSWNDRSCRSQTHIWWSVSLRIAVQSGVAIFDGKKALKIECCYLALLASSVSTMLTMKSLTFRSWLKKSRTSWDF